MHFFKRASYKIFSYNPRYSKINYEEVNEEIHWRNPKLKFRIFNYTPRYYNPAEDKDNESKRIDFSQYRTIKPEK